MTDLIRYMPSDDRTPDEQMRAALEKALEIHGTVINDLNQAMNCLLQMERALEMVGAPNPYQAVVNSLKKKYGMGQHKRSSEWSEMVIAIEGAKMLVEDREELLELAEGEVVDDG